MDTWALGCMFFELLVGLTPFHCYNMQELVRRINDGRYKLACQEEPVMIETCLFLLECLQTNDQLRIKINQLVEAPYISDEYIDKELHPVDNEQF